MKKIDEKFNEIDRELRFGSSQSRQILAEIKHEFVRMRDNLNKIEEGLFGNVDERSIGEIMSTVWGMKLRDEDNEKTVIHWEKLCELIDSDRQRLEDRCERQIEALEVAEERSETQVSEARKKLREEAAVAIRAALFSEEF